LEAWITFVFWNTLDYILLGGQYLGKAAETGFAGRNLLSCGLLLKQWAVALHMLLQA